MLDKFKSEQNRAHLHILLLIVPTGSGAAVPAGCNLNCLTSCKSEQNRSHLHTLLLIVPTGSGAAAPTGCNLSFLTTTELNLSQNKTGCNLSFLTTTKLNLSQNKTAHTCTSCCPSSPLAAVLPRRLAANSAFISMRLCWFSSATRPCILGREASQDLQHQVHLNYERWRWGLAQAVHFGQGSQPETAAASAFIL